MRTSVVLKRMPDVHRGRRHDPRNGLSMWSCLSAFGCCDECLHPPRTSEIFTTMNRFIFLLAMLSPGFLFAAAPAKPFELRDGDRVVFLGDTLMEREKDFGYIELMMTLRFPDRNVTFRTQIGRANA